eukprot:TRINITY_DN530_c0_g2_i2.p1 TRINITY_DN530_c0_g2~~TRINITY_DN530_c0_g2_i2.p1  ORF type:complete len:1064 (-),score=92.86 TRINITY_DN530_c0_g2_i2:116-3007(-)
MSSTTLTTITLTTNTRTSITSRTLTATSLTTLSSTSLTTTTLTTISSTTLTTISSTTLTTITLTTITLTTISSTTRSSTSRTSITFTTTTVSTTLTSRTLTSSTSLSRTLTTVSRTSSTKTSFTRTSRTNTTSSLTSTLSSITSISSTSLTRTSNASTVSTFSSTLTSKTSSSVSATISTTPTSFSTPTKTSSTIATGTSSTVTSATVTSTVSTTVSTQTTAKTSITTLSTTSRTTISGTSLTYTKTSSTTSSTLTSSTSTITSTSGAWCYTPPVIRRGASMENCTAIPMFSFCSPRCLDGFIVPPTFVLQCMYGEWVPNGAGCNRPGITLRLASNVLQANLVFSWDGTVSNAALGASWALDNISPFIASLAQQLGVNYPQILIKHILDLESQQQRRLSASIRLLATAPVGFSIDYIVELLEADDQMQVRDAALLGGANFTSFVKKVEAALIQEGNQVPSSLGKATGFAEADVLENFYLEEHVWLNITDWSECKSDGESAWGYAWKTRQIECSTGNPQACDLGGRLPDRLPCQSGEISAAQAAGIVVAGMVLAIAVCCCIFRCCWTVPLPTAGHVRLKSETGEQRDISFSILHPGNENHEAEPSSPTQRQTDKIYVVWNIDLEDVNLQQDWQIDEVHVQGPNRNALRQVGEGISRAPEAEVEVPSIPYDDDGKIEIEKPRSTVMPSRCVNPTGNGRPAGQVYKSGERVEYWSRTHQRWLPGTVTRALYRQGVVTDLCDLSVGFTSHQPIRQVDLSLMRLPLRSGEAVSVYFVDDDAWLDGEIDGTAVLPTRYGYKVRLLEDPNQEDACEEDAIEFPEMASQLGKTISRRFSQTAVTPETRATPPPQVPQLVPASRIRRRFSPGDQVAAYLGPQTGWVFATIMAKSPPRFSLADADGQVPSPHASPRASPRSSSSAESPRSPASDHGPGFSQFEDYEVQLLQSSAESVTVQLHCLLPSSRVSFL